jgi:predicted nucleotidyltransferase
MLLKERYRQMLLGIFADVNLPVEIWAYGSRVNGSAHDGSDLDLVIRGEHLNPIPIDTLDSLLEKIKESRVPILVELRDWARLPVSFQQNIAQQYEVLFSNLYVSGEDASRASTAKKNE